MLQRLGLAAATLACTFSIGCTSDYMPRPGPRLSMVMDSGSVTYVRDGHKYEGGFLGGDIEGAVQGNPRAEEYASEYKTGMVTGFALTLVSAAGLVAGAVLTGTEAGDDESINSRSPVPGLLVLGGSLVLDVAAVIVLMNAQPHLFDAINAYNDGVKDPAPARSPEPLAPAP
jgi:hypothetical protein